MKYIVKIDNESFEVQIEDVHARPVIAIVDGQEIPVWPEEELPESQTNLELTTGPTASLDEQTIASGAEFVLKASLRPKLVRAPIPGVILAIKVKEGDEVTIGQEICVLEAMKMKNMIRAGREGIISKIFVNPGQNVEHNEPLVEFEE